MAAFSESGLPATCTLLSREVLPAITMTADLGTPKRLGEKRLQRCIGLALFRRGAHPRPQDAPPVGKFGNPLDPVLRRLRCQPHGQNQSLTANSPGPTGHDTICQREIPQNGAIA